MIEGKCVDVCKRGDDLCINALVATGSRVRDKEETYVYCQILQDMVSARIPGGVKSCSEFVGRQEYADRCMRAEGKFQVPLEEGKDTAKDTVKLEKKEIKDVKGDIVIPKDAKKAKGKIGKPLEDIEL